MVSQIEPNEVAAYMGRISILLLDEPSILDALEAQRAAVAGASSSYAPADVAVPAARTFVQALSRSRNAVAAALAEALNADGLAVPITARDIIDLFREADRRLPDGLTREGSDPLDLLSEATTPVEGPNGSAIRGSQADPVDTLTGAMWRVDDDMVVRSEGPTLRLARTWTSQLSGAGVFGHGWRSLLDVRAVREGQMVWLDGPDGSRLAFMRRGASWVGPTWTTTLVDVERDDAGGDRVVAVLADGTRWTFDDEGALAGIHDGEGRGWTITRGATAITCRSTCGRTVHAELRDDRVVRVVGPAGSIGYVHDADLLVEVVHGDRRVRYGHDPAGRVGTVHRDDALLVASDYDERGRVVRQTDVHGGRWAFRYLDGVTEVVHPDGSVVADHHGPDGRLQQQVRDGVAQLRATRVDVDDVAANALDADLRDAGILLGRVEDRDAHGRATQVRTGAAQHELVWGEDDRLVSAVRRDATGVVRTVAQVGLAGEGDEAAAQAPVHVRAVRQGGVEGLVTRDRLGDVVGWSTEAGTWRLRRDALRRPTALEAPDGGTTRWRWSHDGHLLGRTSPVGEAHVARDGQQRPVEVVDGPRTIRLRWDGPLLAGIDLGAGDVAMTLSDDETQMTVRGDGVDADIALADGSPTSITDAGGTHTYSQADGRRVRRHSDAPDTVLDTRADRPVLWADDVAVMPTVPRGDTWLGDAGPGGEVRVDVDLPARTFCATLPNGVTTTAVYDDAGLLTTQVARAADGTTLFHEDLAHDRSGLTTRWEQDGVRWDVERDHVGRLTRLVDDGRPVLEAFYDLAGRLTRRRAAGRDWSVELDDDGLVTRVVAADGAERVLVHDAAGRVVADGPWRFTYNALGRLTVAEDTSRGVRVEHDIDVHGRRTASRTSVDGELRRDLRWSWDTTVAVPRPLLVEDRVSGRRELVRYDASGYPQAIVDPDDPSRDRWLVTDHLGTPRVELDGAGQVLMRHEPDPTGAAGVVDAPGEGPLLRFGFAGALVDAGTGHLHLLDRQMDPTINRFLSPDPVHAGVGAHHQDPYGYCDGRPLDLRDPAGRFGFRLPNPLDVISDAASGFMDQAESVASTLGEGLHDIGMAIDDFYDEHREVINTTVAVAGVVALTLGTAGVAGPAVMALNIAVAAGTAASAADNIGDGNTAAAAIDIATIPLTLAGGQIFRGAGTSVAAGLGATDDARLAGQIANSMAGHLAIFGLPAGHALGSGCPPA